jgi:hypothetical protein
MERETGLEPATAYLEDMLSPVGPFPPFSQLISLSRLSLVLSGSQCPLSLPPALLSGGSSMFRPMKSCPPTKGRHRAFSLRGTCLSLSVEQRLCPSAGGAGPPIPDRRPCSLVCSRLRAVPGAASGSRTFERVLVRCCHVPRRRCQRRRIWAPSLTSRFFHMRRLAGCAMTVIGHVSPERCLPM